MGGAHRRPFNVPDPSNLIFRLGLSRVDESGYKVRPEISDAAWLFPAYAKRRGFTVGVMWYIVDIEERCPSG